MRRPPLARNLGSLWRQPRLTVPAILTLGLGLGAASAVFTLVDATLLRPLPFPAPERLVGFWGQGSWSRAELDFMRRHTQSYDAVGSFTDDEVILSGPQPRVVPMAWTSPDFFHVLAVPPALGRSFQLEEEQPGRAAVVVLSDGFWRLELGADPNAVGSTLELGGELHEVVGVMPPGFSFPLQETELWIPLTMDPDSGAYEGSKFLSLIGRRKADVSLETARQEIGALAPVLQETLDLRPGFDKMAVPATVDPLKAQLNRSTRAPVLVLFAASGLLLLIACVNVAQLLLATALRREQEMAIRGALGADRGTLIRQLLAESLCLAALGGGFGLLLSVWAVDLLRGNLPASTPGLESLAVDGRVFAFGLLASLATAGVFGMLPALQATRDNLRTAFNGGSRGVGETRKRRKIRWVLVAGEMALAALLTVIAVSTVRSFLALNAEHPGFTATGVVSLRPEPTGAAWQDGQKVKAYYDQVLEAAEAVPGIESAGAIWRLPIAEGGAYQVLEIEGHEPVVGEPDWVYWRAVAGDYFGTMGIRGLQGRSFDPGDTADSVPVGVINRKLAESFWPGQSPLGKRLKNSIDEDQWITVVGVVEDVRHESIRSAAPFTLYRPLQQSPPWVTRLAVVAKTRMAADTALDSLKVALSGVDPTVPIHRVTTIDEVLAGSIARDRLTGSIIGFYGALALLLSAVGVFGLLTFSIGERRKEIGIRMALGAERPKILHQVVVEGMEPVLVGSAIGLAAALAVGRLLESFLYQARVDDPWACIGVVGLLLTVALAACWLPAQRAADLEPVDALRND